MKHGQIKRMNQICIDAIYDIIKRTDEGLGMHISFIQGSEILGKKYFRGQLEVIPFDEVKKIIAGNETEKISGRIRRSV